MEKIGRKTFVHKMWCHKCKKVIKGAIKVAQHFEQHNKKDEKIKWQKKY